MNKIWLHDFDQQTSHSCWFLRLTSEMTVYVSSLHIAGCVHLLILGHIEDDKSNGVNDNNGDYDDCQQFSK